LPTAQFLFAIRRRRQDNPVVKTALLTAAFVSSIAASVVAQEPAAQEPAAPAAVVATASGADTRVFELRTYTAPADKLDALQARFRNHTTALFTKHGMTNVGYWLPAANPDRQLVYLLTYPDRAARDASWKSFLADPEWHAVVKESEANGKLVSKVTSLFLTTAPFSPGFSPPEGKEARFYEMRTYIAMPELLPALHARFQNVTLQMFKKHGMTSLGYFALAPEQPGAKQTLVYFLAHKDAQAAAASWDAFRADPEWIAAKQASETAAGGSLTIVGGVKSSFLVPTDYSPIR
jgi:uncharacterized protein YbaA (DUF1428 family)